MTAGCPTILERLLAQGGATRHCRGAEPQERASLKKEKYGSVQEVKDTQFQNM